MLWFLYLWMFWVVWEISLNNLTTEVKPDIISAMNNNEETNMTESITYTQSQVDLLTRDLAFAYQNFTDSVMFSVANGNLERSEAKAILVGAKVPENYWKALFVVVVNVEIRAVSTVEVLSVYEVEVDSDHDEDDLLEAFHDQHGLTASEIIGDNTYDADWQDEDLEVVSSW